MSLLNTMFHRGTTTPDPICGRQIADDWNRWVSNHRGDRYRFCSLACKEEFDADPELYLLPPGPRPPVA